jgi:hypothetical protein
MSRATLRPGRGFLRRRGLRLLLTLDGAAMDKMYDRQGTSGSIDDVSAYSGNPRFGADRPDLP